MSLRLKPLADEPQSPTDKICVEKTIIGASFTKTCFPPKIRVTSMPKKSPNIPNHVAMILDGNRRWAKKRGLRPWKGHFAGVGANAEEVMQVAVETGIKYVTLWVGSYDNLTERSKIEIAMLNKAYRQLIEKSLSDERTYKNKIRIQFIGEWKKLLEPKTVELINLAQRKTASHNKHILTALAGYNGDREMLAAVTSLAKEKKDKVTDTSLRKHLWTGSLPLVDLLIRTGVEGDPHNSTGFMMWHTRYSQYYFTDTLWPDFGKKEFLAALKDFARRERRLGK